MKTALHHGTPCRVLRKNSDGTSLIQYPGIAGGGGVNDEGKQFVGELQNVVSNRALVRTFPKPNPPRFVHKFV